MQSSPSTLQLQHILIRHGIFVFVSWGGGVVLIAPIVEVAQVVLPHLPTQPTLQEGGEMTSLPTQLLSGQLCGEQRSAGWATSVIGAARTTFVTSNWTCEFGGGGGTRLPRRL